MIEGVHHIAIIVSSEESIRFYARLGFSETFRKVRKTDSVVLMQGYGIELEIFIDPSHPNRSNPEPIGLRHLALKVDDIDRMRELFSCDDIKMDWKGTRFTYTYDPDGLPIEFHE